MKITRELAIQLLKYCHEHPDFYFPFLVMCQEYTPEDDDFVEIEPEEWEMISEDDTYQTFELWENLHDVREVTTELLAKGFIEKITNQSLEEYIKTQAQNYRKEWKEELWESTDIEEFGFNEFIGGKAEAFEDCYYYLRKFRGVPDSENDYFWNN